MNDQRTFAMFCTIDAVVFLFAEVADEIAAVRAFRNHVASYKYDDHAPHIHMEPMRAEWAGGGMVDRDTFGPNLFRQPAQVSS